MDNEYINQEAPAQPREDAGPACEAAPSDGQEAPAEQPSAKPGIKQRGSFDKVINAVLVLGIAIMGFVCLRQFGLVGVPKAAQTAAGSAVQLTFSDEQGKTISTGLGYVCFANDTVVTSYSQLDGAYKVTCRAADGSAVELNKVEAWDDTQDTAILLADKALNITPIIDAAEPADGSRVFWLDGAGKLRAGRAAVSDGVLSCSGPAGAAGSPVLNQQGVAVGMVRAGGQWTSIAEIAKLWLGQTGPYSLSTFIYRDTPIAGYVDMIYASMFLMLQQSDSLLEGVKSETALYEKNKAAAEEFSSALEEVRTPVMNRTITPDKIVPMWRHLMEAGETFSSLLYDQTPQGDVHKLLLVYKDALSGYRQSLSNISGMMGS